MLLRTEENRTVRLINSILFVLLQLFMRSLTANLYS